MNQEGSSEPSDEWKLELRRRIEERYQNRIQQAKLKRDAGHARVEDDHKRAMDNIKAVGLTQEDIDRERALNQGSQLPKAPGQSIVESDATQDGSGSLLSPLDGDASTEDDDVDASAEESTEDEGEEEDDASDLEHQMKDGERNSKEEEVKKKAEEVEKIAKELSKKVDDAEQMELEIRKKMEEARRREEDFKKRDDEFRAKERKLKDDLEKLMNVKEEAKKIVNEARIKENNIRKIQEEIRRETKSDKTTHPPDLAPQTVSNTKFPPRHSPLPSDSDYRLSISSISSIASTIHPTEWERGLLDGDQDAIAVQAAYTQYTAQVKTAGERQRSISMDSRPARAWFSRQQENKRGSSGGRNTPVPAHSSVDGTAPQRKLFISPIWIPPSAFSSPSFSQMSAVKPRSTRK